MQYSPRGNTEGEIIGVDLFVFVRSELEQKKKKVEYFTENHSRKIKSFLRERVFSCDLPTWLVVLQAESKADSSHPSRHWGAVVPIPPVEKSILLFNKSIFAAENYDFYGKAIFLLKCQPNLEITEQAPLVRSLKRLKKV